MVRVTYRDTYKPLIDKKDNQGKAIGKEGDKNNLISDPLRVCWSYHSGVWIMETSSLLQFVVAVAAIQIHWITLYMAYSTDAFNAMTAAGVPLVILMELH